MELRTHEVGQHPNTHIYVYIFLRRCTVSLSRSVKTQRTALMDGGIARPLVKLLADSNSSVVLEASAALCNVVLDFSPIKQVWC